MNIIYLWSQGKDSANLILRKVYWRCVFAMRNHLFESAKNKEKVVTFSLNNYILLKYIEFEYLLEDLLKVWIDILFRFIILVMRVLIKIFYLS